MNNHISTGFALLLCLLLSGVYSSALSKTALPPQSSSDQALAAIRRSDAAARGADGKLAKLSLPEHMSRASIYAANRAFAEAREHWQAVIDNYPEHPRAPEAMFGIGRAYFQEKHYQEAFKIFNRLASNYGSTKEGREGLNYSGAALLRLGKFDEAASRYADYVARYPDGERIDTAHLNVIDTLREAGRPDEALEWVAKTKKRFAGSTTETNAIFAQLRLNISESRWGEALSTAEQLRNVAFTKGVATTPSEVAYLKAFSLEQSGRKEEAFTAYLLVPDNINSYYGWLATEKMLLLQNVGKKPIVEDRIQRVNSAVAAAQADYPAPYRESLVRVAKARKLDPRFVLALMKQESVFRPTAKSPAGARGLLQLTMDTARKYARGAGLTSLQETQLYQPEASIKLGGEYLAQLSSMFPQMLEAVAASYNGGEDNVARWLKRARVKDRGVFTSEVGFDETKVYVQKVMANYRAYRHLYTAELVKRF